MLDSLIPQFLSLWFNTSNAKVQLLKSANWSDWLNAEEVQRLTQPRLMLDKTADDSIKQHLTALSQTGLSEGEQGVWIQAGNDILAEHQGTVPLPAASLTKVATTLAALATWSPDHQFETLVGITGPVQSGVVQGDLIVQGSGDPFFVWEEAIALGNALNQAGIQRIAGDLIITGGFAMNYETDPTTAGRLLRQGMNSTLWAKDIETQYLTLPMGTSRPQVVIDGSIQSLPVEAATPRITATIVKHQSLPLSQILKAMNIYSNNIMSEMLADSLGGAQKVAELAAQSANVPLDEIQLINGSGLGVENQISARAVVAMFTAIQRKLQSYNLNTADLFPVIGRDRGTLSGRRIPISSAVKTGTLADVSSLAGVIPTRSHGLVWFAIINRGWDLQDLRNQQDVLLQNLVQTWDVEQPAPNAIQPNDLNRKEGNQLGAPIRNKILENE